MPDGILFITPHHDAAQRVAHILSGQGRLDHSPSLASARDKIAENSYSVVLTDTDLPDANWEDVLKITKELAPRTEVIVTDAHCDARKWSEVLHLGAYDLIAQPFYEAEVQRILGNACSRTAVVG